MIVAVPGQFSCPTPLDYSGENTERAMTPTRDYEENREIDSRNSFNSPDYDICSNYNYFVYLYICKYKFEAQFCLSTLCDVVRAMHLFLLGGHFY